MSHPKRIDREQILMLRRSGLSYGLIAELVGCSLGGAHRVCVLAGLRGRAKHTKKMGRAKKPPLVIEKDDGYRPWLKYGKESE